MTVLRLRLSLFMLAASALVVSSTANASAQESHDASIDFELGDFDSDQGDWPITVVNVSGDLEPDEVFVVELRDGEGEVIWAGEGVFSPPTTSVTVDSFVAVGDVDEAAIGQLLPEETTTTTTATVEPVVAGDVVTIPTTTTTTPPETPEVTEETAPPPTVEGDVTAPPEPEPEPEPELPQQGSGVGGAGQLALSMVIAVVFVAILFRAPLPAATTQRWRR